MFELLSEIARSLQVDRSAAAQLLAALAALLVSVAATLAAFISARATAKSVKEMKAARIQSSRAVLEILPRQQYIYTWDRNEEGPKFVNKDTGEVGRPAIHIRNIGTGPALDVQLWTEDKPSKADSDIRISELRRLFAAAGISVYKANNGIEFRDSRIDNRPIVRIFTRLFESMSHIETIAIGADKKLDINLHLMESFVVRSLAEFQDGHFSWFSPCILEYENLSGEIVKQEYYLAMMSDPPTFTIGSPVAQFDGVVSWSKLELEISVYLAERPRDAPLMTIINSKTRVWASRRVAPLVKLRNIVALWAKNRILYGGKPPERFQIGDRVLFKPAEEWEICVEGDEETVPEPELIDTSKWKRRSGGRNNLDEVDPEEDTVKESSKAASAKRRTMTRSSRTRRPSKPKLGK